MSINKNSLKEYLLQNEDSKLDNAYVTYETYIADSDIDEYDTIDPDDLSHSDAGSEITDNLDKRIHNNVHDLDTIMEIDFSPTDTIRSGAIAKINNKYIIVAVARRPFSYDGNQYIGISTESPAYTAMAGKKAGDSLEINGKKYTITEVL